VAPKEISEFVVAPSEKLSSLNAFEKVFHLAWKLESIIANWIADAYMVFGSLIDSQYPVIFFRERDPILFDRYRDFGLDHPSSFYNIPDNLFYRGARLNELFQLDPNLAWPIDIALIFTGEEGDSRLVYQSRGAFKTKLNEAATFTTQSFKNLIPETFRQTPKFLEISQESPNQSPGMNLFQVYREASVVHSMIVFKALYDLFQYGSDIHILRSFLQAQTICQHLLRILGLSPLVLSRQMTIIRLVGSHLTESGVTSRLIGPGNHGCLMVIGPINSLARVFEEALPKIHEETEKVVHCHYASWRDGYPPADGVRVEQYIEAGLYSSFTNSRSVTMYEWNGSKKSPPVLYTLEKLEEERKKFDLLLDGKEGRVFVRTIF
jgi:hypothetical protein